MAHRLAGARDSESHQAHEEESTDGSSKSRLTRRDYMKQGMAAAVVVGAGTFATAAGDAGGSTYSTDFSGGNL